MSGKLVPDGETQATAVPAAAYLLSEEDKAHLQAANAEVRKRMEAPRHSHKLAPDELIRAKVKQELRGRMRGVRATARGASSAARCERIVCTLQALPALLNARRVGLFWPMLERNEVDLRALATWLLGRGAEVGLPCVVPASEPDARAGAPAAGAPRDMVFRRFVTEADLTLNAMGIAEPLPHCALLEELDVVVTPALLVDSRGHRIGYGGGYYDKYFSSQAVRSHNIAVVFDYQLVAEIPNQPWDISVAHVVTDKREFSAE